MKNLVIIHLESLSSFVYNLNKEAFPNLNFWVPFMDKYINYYSSATSTQMVIADMFFGNMDVFESAKYLEDLYVVKHYEKSIFNRLSEKGYSTCYCAYGLGESRRDRIYKLAMAIDEKSDFIYEDEKSRFKSKIESFVSSKKNGSIALFISDFSSHISYKGEDVRDKGNIINRYSVMDQTVGYIFNLIKKERLLDDTVFVLYGDHGDEIYFHGLHEGYTHAIEPFKSLIHCPLFIYNSTKTGNTYHQVVSTEDISDIVMSHLKDEEVNVNRKFAYSRNLLANQTRKADIFVKAYGVTDGKYGLMVSKKGLAMYIYSLDPLNVTNLLNFFKLSNKQIEYDTIFDELTSSHFKSFMSKKQIEEIKKEFSILSEMLKMKVNSEEFLGKGQINFNKINKNREYILARLKHVVSYRHIKRSIARLIYQK